MTQNNSIIQALREYFLACPLMGKERVSVDSLDTHALSYSVGTTPADEVLERYVSGSSMRQYVFELSAAFPAAESEAQAAENAAFFERLAAWLSAQTKARCFPALPIGCTARKIKAISSAYFDGMDADTRVYAIQCQLIYFQKGER